MNEDLQRVGFEIEGWEIPASSNELSFSNQ